VSPRRSDPEMRPRLVGIAARLLDQEGPGGLSTRRLTAEAGCSTMVLYTHFGGMTGLVREVVHEGFARLRRQFDLVVRTDDPVADMAVYGHAYRLVALAGPHVHAVMFGTASLSGFSLSEADRWRGRRAMAALVSCAGRCVAAGRFTVPDAALVAHQFWSALHGLVTLELGGYLAGPYDADRCNEAQLTGLMVGAGDAREAAHRSVAGYRERWYSGLMASCLPLPPAGGPRR
jgi:AcrR family transcriptional regulator